MFSRKLNLSKCALLAATLLTALVLWMTPTTFAVDTGHIGEKPDIGQGDGIPQDKPGLIRSGEQLGKELGDPSKGDDPARNNDIGDPASDGGDGIPNGGPIEGTGHKGKGLLESSIVFGIFPWLFSL